MIGKEEIAARLREIAAYMRLLGEDRFKARAYENAGDALDILGPEFHRLLSHGQLTEIPGIGASLAAVISELARSGSTRRLEELRQHLPPTLLQLTQVPGLTLPRIRALHQGLGIETLEQVKEAARQGRLQALKGFGAKTESKLLASIERWEQRPERLRLVEAREILGALARRLAALPSVSRAEVAGSTRRWKETVGTGRLVIESPAPGAALPAILAAVGLHRLEQQGETRARLRLTSGPVELVVVDRAHFAGELLRQTGSRAHLERLDQLCRQRGLDLGGLQGDDEAACYRQLGLPEIPPELREDAGEIEAALAGDDFADLVTARDIRGMTHCHSTYSDGKASIAEMAAGAAALGKEYLTITDHSPTASYAGGVGEDRLPAQWQEIAAAQQDSGVRLLRGTESDILGDGALDYPDQVLARLEVVIASIHNRLHMDEGAMTERLVRMMQSPFFKIWGHPLGRLILRREPIACRVDEILEAGRRSGRAAIEINGDPYRLDLPPEWVRRARDLGLAFVISTDAHSVSNLSNLPFGVAMARRGGVRRGQVLNALSADDFAAAVRPAPP